VLFRLLALLLVLGLALTVPVAGCRKPAQPPAGQTEPGGGGTGSGPSGQPSGQPVRWTPYAFKAGQYYKYNIKVVADGNAQEGWFSLAVSDAGGGNLNLHYEGNFAGMDFSATATCPASDPVTALMSQMNPIAAVCVLPMFMTPWALYFTDAQWSVGSQWTVTSGPDTVSFKVTGQETYAGVTGYVGEWTVNGTVVATFCVGPSVPLVLHSKMGEDAQNYVEYTLVEATGF